MKILHTSDWHLGSKLFEYSKDEEMELFFKWFIELLKNEKIDILIISGDIFDTQNPSNKALKSYYNFLSIAIFFQFI
jgi:exonuclease SbcD